MLQEEYDNNLQILRSPSGSMVELLLPKLSLSSPASTEELLASDEVVAVVDDSPEIVLLLSQYLQNRGFQSVAAGNVLGLYQLLNSCKVALVLLDIGLPDQSGTDVLKELSVKYPELGIIMVTGTIDIDIALDCLRHGADDYLTKPVNISHFTHTVEITLKKRRLALNNLRFQQELQKANNRMRFLHHLNLKMNTAYLNTVELQGILQAILVGITSDDGLRFNRAFLALFNEGETVLQGQMAIGPYTKEEASQVWQSIKEKGLQLDDILDAIQDKTIQSDIGVNTMIQTLAISTSDTQHVLIHAAYSRKSIMVTQGQAEGCTVPFELLTTLGESSFAVVPLFSPEKSLGVIIVDNFVTGSPITEEDISGLEIFASQASLAIEHSHLYEAMARQIAALETVTEELEKSKNLLVAAERTSAIGDVSAQLLHSIRNPLTSIGGTSRLLQKKMTDPGLSNFLQIITDEASKIETLLEDLFSFVEDDDITLAPHDVYALLRKSVMIFYPTMKSHKILYEFSLEGESAILQLDEKKIRQVFVHLIRNAIEAMSGGGKLLLSGKQLGTSVSITISDTGKGIPDAILPLVTNPFYTTKMYGNGMGLAIVEQIVSAHGGQLQLINASGSGTQATITLPTGTTT